MPKGVALPSIQHALPSSTARTERLLARPPAPTRISRWKCPCGERPEILLQPLVGRQVQHLVRLIAAAFLPRGHGVTPAVVRAPGGAEFVPSKATLF